jgi:hypothetical protein
VRILHLLTKRGLVLGNLVLAVVFILVAVAAIRPLLSGGPQLRLAVNAREALNSGQAPEAGQGAAMLDEYARIIESNNVFSAKMPKPEKPTPPPPPPPRDPSWELAGTWSPEPGTWEATIKDASRPRGQQELVAREGTRFHLRQYDVVVTEVTAQQVRFEIHTKEHGHPFERVLTREGVSVVDSGQSDRR